ncbi:fatty acid-binding protein, heart-like [Genypterus blacodes]|uniref:fatty acid-binding protein, heart-like n=1 Tax=Genypterus blacodes TaxID=154954 RepID=UPI003F7595A1
MVENFVGSWKMVSSEKFDDYLKAVGVGFAIRQMAGRATPKMIFSVDDDGCICLKTESTFKRHQVKFKLGETFHETTPDGRKTSNVVNMEGDKLVHKQSWDGKEAIIERAITDGKMVVKLTMGDVVSVRTFAKEA